jgi:hypothetical protein
MKIDEEENPGRVISGPRMGKAIHCNQPMNTPNNQPDNHIRIILSILLAGITLQGLIFTLIMYCAA